MTFGREPRPSSRTAAVTSAGILGLDGDRPRRAPRPVPHLGELGHRSRRRCSARAACAPRRRARVGLRLDDLVDELRRACTRRARASGRRRRARRAPSRRRRAASGNTRLQHRLPLLEPVVVDALEPLHVHQPVADLDRRVARDREQVELVALLHALRRQRGRGGCSASPKLVAEGAPLPARDDPRARRLSSRSGALSRSTRAPCASSSPARRRGRRRWSAEERTQPRPRPGTPRSSRQRVESSSTREPSG